MFDASQFVCKVKPSANRFFRIRKEDSSTESFPVLKGEFASRKQASSRWSFKLPSTSLSTAVHIRMAILFTNFLVVRQNPRVLVLSEKDYTQALDELASIIGSPCHIQVAPTDQVMKAIISQENFDLIMVDKDTEDMEEFLNSDITIAKSYQIFGY